MPKPESPPIDGQKRFIVTLLSSLKMIYDTCRPRGDVKEGTTKDEPFAADLAQVVNKTGPRE